MDKKTLKQIGLNLKRLRTFFSYTQDELSERLDTSAYSYSRYERGRQMPPVTFLYDLSVFYNLPVWLILDTDEKEFNRRFVFYRNLPVDVKNLIEMYQSLPLLLQGMLLEHARILLEKDQKQRDPPVWSRK